LAHSKFLTNHAEVLAFIYVDPNARIRDVCKSLGITERTATKVVAELVEDGYLSVEKEGRRNHYKVRRDVPLHHTIGRERTIGEFLEMLLSADVPTP
jgi:predicted transcriptional regulator